MLNYLRKPFFLFGVILVFILGSCGGKEEEKLAKTFMPGTYAMVFEGKDWGPALTKVIVNSGKKLSTSEFTPFMFELSLKAQGYRAEPDETIPEILDAYASDSTGSRTDGKTEYITFELSHSPADAFSNPFLFELDSRLNIWKEPYELVIVSSLFDEEITQFAGFISPLADQFHMGRATTGDVTLSYAFYAPVDTKEKKPLIIWLHGGGEGGTDPYITVLGNKVVNLASEEIQNLFGEAYILAPQSPTVWMNATGEKYSLTKENPKSMYTEAIMELVRKSITNNSGIDTNRIYVGGCSNGGYMTLNLLINYPDFFAAAFPVCEGYPDEWITDNQIESLKDTPIWFTHAKNDSVLDPQSLTVATFQRLKAAGARDIHFTFYDSVIDVSGNYTDGKGMPYQYNGHWSWIYTLNNHPKENGVTIMEWLSKQRLNNEK